MASQELRFPLGSDLYVTLTDWRGDTKIHIRRFTVLEGETQIRPTKFGVALNLQQFRQLCINCPLIEQEMLNRSAPLQPELFNPSYCPPQSRGNFTNSSLSSNFTNSSLPNNQERFDQSRLDPDQSKNDDTGLYEQNLNLPGPPTPYPTFTELQTCTSR